MTSGPLSARDIAIRLSLHRTDAYKKLEELCSLGMIQVTLQVPKLYSCVEPEFALASLMKREERRVRELKLLSQKMARRLNALISTYSYNQSMRSAQDQSHYKYLNNWDAYVREVKRIVSFSKKELVLATTARGIKRGHIFNFHILLKKLALRGVSIKIATELSDENLGYLIKLSEFAEVRHLPGIRFKAVVSDGKIACLCPRFDDSLSPLFNCYFVFQDIHTAQALQYMLNQVWSLGKPLQSKQNKKFNY